MYIITVYFCCKTHFTNLTNLFYRKESSYLLTKLYVYSSFLVEFSMFDMSFSRKRECTCIADGTHKTEVSSRNTLGLASITV